MLPGIPRLILTGLCCGLPVIAYAADIPAAANPKADQTIPTIGPATHPATITAPREPAGMVKIFNGTDLTGFGRR